MGRDNIDERAQQPVIAIAVGGRLDGELERLGYLQRRHRHWCCRPMQQIYDVRAGGDLFIERHGAGLGDRIQAVECDHREHLHELPVAVGVAGEPLTQPGHRGR